MTDAAPPRQHDGRGSRWRAGMALAAVAFLGAGAALVVWPQVLAYAAAGALGVLGLFCLVSAVAAKGR